MPPTMTTCRRAIIPFDISKHAGAQLREFNDRRAAPDSAHEATWPRSPVLSRRSRLRTVDESVRSSRTCLTRRPPTSPSSNK
jgi:hypothetical protein